MNPNIRIEIEGLKELREAFTNLEAQFDDAALDAIQDTALAIRTRVIDLIQRGPASGRTYRKSSPARVHTASAPGQPPATDTGRLVGSIYFDLGADSATVGSRLVYAWYLEYGTRNMAPRPVWNRIAEEERAMFAGRLSANLKKIIR